MPEHWHGLWILWRYSKSNWKQFWKTSPEQPRRGRLNCMAPKLPSNPVNVPQYTQVFPELPAGLVLRVNKAIPLG